MQTAVRNFLLTAGFLAVAIFYYWMNWPVEVTILGGDHAVYLLTADHPSPFSDRGYDVTRAALSYSYFPPVIFSLTVVNNHPEALNGVV